MKKELYAYACPKLSKEHTSPLNMIFVIVSTTLVSAMVAIFVNLIRGLIITALYLGLSLLTFLDKDIKSRYLMLISLCILDISIAELSIFSLIYSDYPFPFCTLIFALIFAVIYEIVVFVKIKQCYYTSPNYQNKIVKGVSISITLLAVFTFKILNKIPMFQNLLVIILMILSSITLLGFMICIQKLIVYLLVRNKL